MTLNDSLYDRIDTQLRSPPRKVLPVERMGFLDNGNIYIRDVPDLDEQFEPVVRPIVEVTRTQIMNPEHQNVSLNLTQQQWREYFAQLPKGHEHHGMTLPTFPLLNGIIYRTWQELQSVDTTDKEFNRELFEQSAPYQFSQAITKRRFLVTETRFEYLNSLDVIVHHGSHNITTALPEPENNDFFVENLLAPEQPEGNEQLVDPRVPMGSCPPKEYAFYNYAFGPTFPHLPQAVQHITSRRNNNLRPVRLWYPSTYDEAHLYPGVLDLSDDIILCSILDDTVTHNAFGVRLR